MQTVPLNFPGNRHATVHLPDVVPHDTPLILAFHAGESNPDGFATQSQMDRAVDAGFIVAYPQGTSPFPGATRFNFNAGGCCGSASKFHVDDVQFTKQLLAECGIRWPLNPKRIYITGFSNGALMCYHLAQAMPGRFAAIAPVSGSVVKGYPMPTGPLRVLHFHGGADQHCPPLGGVGSQAMDKCDYYPVDEVLRSCAGPEGAGQPGPATSIVTPFGADSLYYLFGGAGHQWPRTDGFNVPGLGATALFDATESIIQFFAK